LFATLSAQNATAQNATSNMNATAQNATSNMNATAQNATSNMNATAQNATLPPLIVVPVPVPVVNPVTLFSPPPGYDEIREHPSYSVRIPFSSLGNTTFDPPAIAIPVDMTVIWFNDDQNPHKITSVSNGSTSLPSFASAMIAPQGFFTYKFTQPGTYVYQDSVNPSAKGKITVGDTIEIGNNMDMLIGGDVLPFNASQLKRLTVSFVPTNTSAITIPPNLNLLYNVSIGTSNTTLFSKQFQDRDGILDLELVPTSKSSSVKHFVTWGPDVGDIAGHRNSGTYHIQGPVLVEDEIYLIKVDIVSKDGMALSPPITDTFIIPSVGGK
jgi:plastocyanin